jgi:hypothetical protein
LFSIVSQIFIVIGIVSALIITVDIFKHPQKEMPIMNLVWPINGLWAGFFGVWAYFTIGKNRKMNMSNMNDMDMSSTSTAKYSSFWQGVIADTLHCGAGCSLADLIGPWIFLAFPFAIFNNFTFGEWTLDYFLALLTGVTFQYAAIAPMMNEKGLKVWLRALKIDFLSLTSWQIGMYGWMALVIFVLFGHLSPTRPEFWFMMQIAMCCGFVTAYPVNWWLVKSGIKMGM